jgi:D-alanyl-D-alanine carboxypeptidase
MKVFPPILVLFLVTITVLSCDSNDPAPAEAPTLAEEMQQIIDNALDTYGGKGVSAAVLIPGEPMWTGVSGYSHGTTPVTRAMTFSVGSTTKWFTASTILKLQEEGKLSIDDSLHAWLPSLPNIDSTITIRQLLNHTSGIFNITRHPDIWSEILGHSERNWEIEEMVRAYTLAPSFPKGTDWGYSNTGYLLLRMIIREASGSQIASEYRNRFFQPLSFPYAHLAVDENPRGAVAHGWFDLSGNGRYDDLTQIPMTAFYTGVGGGVFATAEEMALWAKAFFIDQNVVSEPSFDAMMEFHSPCDDEPMVAGYGLGIVRFEPSLFNGLDVWGHSGDAPGYAAASLYLPQFNVCIGYLTNTEEGEAMNGLADLMTLLVSRLN